MGCTQSKCCSCGGEEEEEEEEELGRTTLSPGTAVTESFESVYNETLQRFDLNHETFGNVEELKTELSNNPQLVSFIEDYLKTSITTLELFSSLEECLHKAHSIVYLAGRAVYFFESGESISSILSDLKDLKAQGNPFHTFPQDFVDELKSLCELHGSHIQRLAEREKDLDRKLGNVKYWKKVGYSVCFAASIGLLIGCVVLAITGAPPVAITMLGLASSAVPLLGKGIDLLLDRRKSSPDGERDAIVELKKQTLVAIHELINVNALVKELDEHVESVDEYAGFPMKGGDGEEEVAMRMTVAMYDIKTKSERLKTRVEELKKEVNLRRENMRAAVATILVAVRNSKFGNE